MPTRDFDDERWPIVVGVDGSGAGDLAVRWAAETAAARDRRLRIVHAVDLAAATAVLEPYDLIVSPVREAMREHSVDCLAAAQRLAESVDSGLRIDTASVDGTPARVLIEQSATAHVTAIGAWGISGGGLLGSTVLSVCAHAHGAVVVVRDTGSEQQTRHTGPVVVGVDGSESSRAAVAAAFFEANERRCELVVVHCWSDLRFGWFAGLPDRISDRRAESAAQELVAQQLAGWADKYPDVTVRCRLYMSGPCHHLVEWSKSAQLVITGSRGRGGFAGLLLGSTSNALVQSAHCPVMVVHRR
ncbi:universal stress protein [Nocardia cyriacigeorgica]|uniref:universal stress protein n=1 Tax=Nocardia cyriacigeorgica TaxID=135487 RepID=UPI001893057F|nr:universal stress protein [Nocardia cyriacigeorgica]MBF6161708.1 universal stress protein [Nocardia cyriacigeorgica]MBF6200506.1 universal stress protein [Nocardia cyriacigeorgica]MBF6317222.1 universal stress protein [Nocardia cyriacigeorgica]MBF6323330.1 universal stress protein [Nocardia cyriacigeorgica]MBF6428466.1 universal stress protein [Nocardia cyriacigeorgica]